MGHCFGGFEYHISIFLSYFTLIVTSVSKYLQPSLTIFQKIQLSIFVQKQTGPIFSWVIAASFILTSTRLIIYKPTIVIVP